MPYWMNSVIKMKGNLIACVVFIILLSFHGCASTPPSVTKDAEVEFWQLELSGQTQGNLEMTLQRAETQKGVYSISGKIVGEIKDHLGGEGKGDYKIKGSVKDGVLKANLTGHSRVTEGLSAITGNIQGKLFNMEGSGTWNMNHALGSSSGSYTIKKMILK